MSLQLLGRFTLALVAGLSVMALAGSAAATNNNNSKRVLVTCPAGQDPNGDTRHTTGIQIRNITSQNHAFFVKSVKIYSQAGALVKNMPTPDAFPPAFLRDPPAHSATVFALSDVFGTQSTPLLSVVFDIQISSSIAPYLIMAVHFDRGADGSVFSRDAQPCVERV